MKNHFIRPIVSELSELTLPEIETIFLPSGLSIHLNNAGSTDAVKLDVLIKAGRPQERKPLTSKAVGSIISRGTFTKSREEIDQLVDQKGAALFSAAEPDLINIGLYTIARHAQEMFDLVKEVVSMPSFAEIELIKFIKRGKQRLKEDLSNPSVLAYRNTTEKIFGKDHPYGYNSSTGMFDGLRTEDLLEFYSDNFTPHNTHLIITCDRSKNIEGILADVFFDWAIDSKGFEPQLNEPAEDKGTEFLSYQKDNLQSAFCMGRTGPPGGSETFDKTQILSLIFGGFFGSRLIKEIREKKGLVYDIHSSLDALRYGSLFMISGECNKDSVDEVRASIKDEMLKLQEKLLSQDEIAMVKNYAMGMIMNTLDGPLHTADWMKSVIAENGSWDALSHFSSAIRNIEAADIQQSAKDFLNGHEFFATWVS